MDFNDACCPQADVLCVLVHDTDRLQCLPYVRLSGFLLSLTYRATKYLRFSLAQVSKSQRKEIQTECVKFGE